MYQKEEDGPSKQYFFAQHFQAPEKATELNLQPEDI